MANSVRDFKVSIQFSNHGGSGAGAGAVASTGWAADVNTTTSPWIGDSDAWDPDGVRVELSLHPTRTLQQDVRFGMQMADWGLSGSDAGPTQYTPWAGDVAPNDGDSNPAEGAWAGDSDSFDPDAGRISLNTRPWPHPGRDWYDVRLGIQVADQAGNQPGNVQWTPWASDGGGWSGWARDPDNFDFDVVKLWMQVRVHALP